MKSDDIAPLPRDPQEDIFEFGDQTIYRMWRQPFDLAGNPANPDDLGTMVIRPLRPAAVAAPAPVEIPPANFEAEGAGDLSTITIRPSHTARAAEAFAAAERLGRLEAKVDALTLAVETLQKTLDTIHEALAQTR